MAHQGYYQFHSFFIMEVILLGSSGRLAKEFIVELNTLGIKYHSVTSKDRSTLNIFSELKSGPFRIYDFMSSLRPNSKTGNTEIEKEIRLMVFSLEKILIEKYIFISTAGELYKTKGKVNSVNDILSISNRSIYANHKLEIENAVIARFNKQAKILRVTNIYGGRFKSRGLGVVDNWLSNQQNLEPPLIHSDINTFRNFVEVQSVLNKLLNYNSDLIEIVASKDYYYLNEIHKLIFDTDLVFKYQEQKFDLSSICHESESCLKEYILKRRKKDFN